MTREVKIGKVTIGGNNKIAVQSMTNTDTKDALSTAAQINALSDAGADLVRFSVYNDDCVCAIPIIKANTKVPLVADIHFDHRIAIKSIEAGIDKLRINPGNIGGRQNVKSVVACAKAHHVPIRVGVNSGSVEKELLHKYGGVCAHALCESALSHVKMLEDEGFYDTVISIKASDVRLTVASCRRLAAMCDYPLHIGVTESGYGEMGSIKSAIGIGSLLLDDIGATMRVSLTGNPVQEVYAAKAILRAVGRDKSAWIDYVSCPTCGRTTGDLRECVEEVKKRLSDLKPKRYVKIAVMGCVVNGPGEGKDADIGIAFAPGGAMVFRGGETAYSGEREATFERFISDCREVITHD